MSGFNRILNLNCGVLFLFDRFKLIGLELRNWKLPKNLCGKPIRPQKTDFRPFQRRFIGMKGLKLDLWAVKTIDNSQVELKVIHLFRPI